MGASLSSLFISQSYQSLIHLGTDTTITTFSATPAELQDGFGNGSGILLDNAGNIIASGSIQALNDISSSTLNGVGNVTLYSASVASRLAQLEADSGSQDQRLDSLEAFSASQESKDATLAIYTASVNNSLNLINGFTQSAGARIDSIENYTASLKGALTVNGNDVTFANDITVVGTINAYEIITTIESSSVIFSSGSNILGDALDDIQTLNGTVIISGSQDVSGSAQFTGTISSPTITGINARLTDIEGFTSSADSRLDNLELYTASFSTNYVSQAQLAAATGALELSIATKLNTSSFEAYTQSADQALNSLSQSVATTTAETNIRIDGLASFTGSYATTGSNTFRGNQTITGSLEITGSMVYSGSVRGVVIPITVTSNTASMDCSLGNFFTVSLPSGSNRLIATNIQPGETLSLRILNTTNASELTGSTSVKFPSGFNYVPTTVSSSYDIVTFLTFDTGSIYAVASNYFV